MTDLIPCDDPPKPGILAFLRRRIVFPLVTFIVVAATSPYLAYLALRHWSFTFKTIKLALRPSIKTDSLYKNHDKLAQILATQPSLDLFKAAAEFQLEEGYCAPTTVHMVLKSIPGFDKSSLPVMRPGPSVCSKLASSLDSMSRLGGVETNSVIIPGNVTYSTFLDALENVNNARFRVSANFLRSPLFNVKPFAIITSIFFSGHFSPIVGFDKLEEIVVVFDVNNTFGLYAVDAKRFYDAVNTYDATSGCYRGLVISEVL